MAGLSSGKKRMSRRSLRLEEALLMIHLSYGEDKDLTEDYQKDIWEFGY